MTEPGHQPDSGGVRRRRSSQQDVDEITTLEQDATQRGQPSNTAHGPSMAGAVSHSRHTSMSSTTGVDAETAAAAVADPGSRTVRFSADVDRAEESGLRSPVSPLSPLSSSSSLPRGRGTGLSVDTGGQTGTDIMKEGIVQSPSRSKSPMSPASRLRGYSLRSSLFRRNVQDGTSTSAIELQETRSSASSGAPDSHATAVTSKKSPHTSVTITPVAEGLSRESSPQSKKDGALAALPNYDSWMRTRPEKAGVKRRFKDAVKAIKKTVFRIQELPPTKNGRHITLDASRKKLLVDERTNRPYVENWIRSTRFTAYNFLPKQFIAQFSKLANFYFLCISILQMIPGLSTTGSK
jgi:phospholipid-translocating ATPase